MRLPLLWLLLEKEEGKRRTKELGGG